MSSIKNGFTLIELLIVIAVMAILTSIVFVVLNPLSRFQEARNSRRWSDVASYINAVKLYQFDNNGLHFDALNGMPEDLYYQIGSGSACNVDCFNPAIVLQEKCLDFRALVESGYLPAIIVDPKHKGKNGENTNYYVYKSSSGAITIGSCGEELGRNSSIPDISITR